MAALDSGAILDRFTPAVKEFLPVVAGETFNDYITRAARHPSPAVRAMVAANVQAAFREEREKRAFAKSAWIASARRAFQPGPRRACSVCGRYRSLADAHHIVPLGIQFDAGAPSPIQEFAWLCPTHHAAIHAIIRALVGRKATTEQHLEEDVGTEDWESLQGLAVRFVRLWSSLPDWWSAPR